ncbi:M48 family metallopeptidase [Acinetobacter sp. S40]|uniref:YgjP family zinc-dependent metalloprotease n=1 Tax=unclassified Acinetobacter TaxID=196816 RepID=UPI00190C9B54|nr:MULTISPECIES: SprT family zinc-dependent metalloprotease [unclassified Acinetobacter]MBJ9984485.1 M48 family metallopeptidase [Acinetobacter sp. S40]MBK0062202.1 M48 family metallopeptidase [Acinetobacter sp. S55]MBK0066006.1 M48 family metallopeptidase [Acinetobacter sp. S54]
MQLQPLPEIKIVRHVRARRLRLRVEPHQVRLTVPLFCTKKQIQQFLDQSQDWLMQTWQKQTQQQLANSNFQHIRFFNQELPYQIISRKQHKNYMIDSEQACIFIREDKGAVVLKDVVYEYAKQYLPLYLGEISQQIELSFSDCSIKRPKTRWGSCSAQHNIMLHAGLVLMQPEIVRYVCVHELAHTRYFNHSAQFWAEVEKFDPDYLIHRKQLKSYQLPAWWY